MKIKVDVSGVLFFIAYMMVMTTIYIESPTNGLVLLTTIGGSVLACLAEIKITITKD